MLMKLAKQSVKCCFQTEIENNIPVSFSELKREYRYCYSSWGGLVIVANQYDEVIDGVPAGSKMIIKTAYALS